LTKQIVEKDEQLEIVKSTLVHILDKNKISTVFKEKDKKMSKLAGEASKKDLLSYTLLLH
jgi:hypothetical protein